jgi:class 3 adenylate cyclase/tetratricopeptide (TPR) repeat protein
MGTRTCPACGAELPDQFRICGYCGAPLGAAAPPAVVRKTVTIVFSDLAASTKLGEQLDSEALRAVMDRYFDAMRDALARHGGTIEKFIGDAVMAVFGLPVVHEDDALRAVRAAHAMGEALEELNAALDRELGITLANRTGVNTGEVVTGDPGQAQRLVTGDAVNVAARLEQAAPHNGILLGELTHRLVRDAVESEPVEPLTLKGKSEPVPAHRLLGLRRAPRRNEVAFTGRERELEALRRGLEDAADGGPRLRLVIGPPGVGKSRLVGEFARRSAASARVLRGRCLPYGRGITFWPFAELVKDAAGFEETDDPAVADARLRALAGDPAVHSRVAAAIGMSAEAFPLEELFWGARKLLERLAAEHPLVAIFDDVHWAERSFLALLQHVLHSSTAPVLLLCTARQEVLELAPELIESPEAEAVTLDGLRGAEVDAIVRRLGGGAVPPPAVRGRIIAAAQGNPLYAEQLFSMLVDNGTLRRGDSGWTVHGRLDEMAVPPTMQAIIAARLDELRDIERSVIEPASVVGFEFEVEAVRALAPTAAPEIAPSLDVLSRKQLVRPLVTEPEDEALYRFEHQLVRDSAYGRLLKRVRAELHERFVAWAEAAFMLRRRGDELDEILGYHLEQAHRYLHDLGPLDEHGRALGEGAAQRLASAGRRAFAREDMPAAANLLRRAAALLPRGDVRRLPLLLPLSEAFADIAETALAESTLMEAIEIATAAGDAATLAGAELRIVQVRAQGGGDEDHAERIVEAADSAIAALEEAGDEAELATAWRALAWAHGTVGRFGETAAAAEYAIVHATRAGDVRQQRRAAAQYAVAALYGPTPADAAIRRCEGILRSARGDRRTEGLVSSLLARLVAMQGDVERGRSLYRHAQATLAEAARDVVAASTSLDSCGVEVLAGDLAAAEAELRRDYAALEALGERYLRSTVAGELARVLAMRGDGDAAWTFSRAAEELAALDDVASQALWRLGRARLLARSEPGEAVRLANDAVQLLAATDARVTQAEALRDLAEVCFSAGREAEAHDAAARALELHEAKGNVVAAAGTRALLEGARPGAAGQRM